MTRMTDMMVDKGFVDDKPIADISEIVRVATRGFELKDNDDPASFTDELKPLDVAGQMLVMIAMRMMRHKNIAMATANQGTIERCQKLAQHFGASIKQELGEPNTGTDGKTILIFSPPPSTELKLLLEDVKNIATRSFLAQGEMVSRFILVFEDDNRLTVPCSWSDDAQKRQRLGRLKQTIREHGRLKRYAYGAEVWAGLPNEDVRPSKSPNRTEHLMVLAAERFSLPIGGWFDIKRHALSPMPTLGSWVTRGDLAPNSLFDLFDDDDDDQSSDDTSDTATTGKPVMPAFVFERCSHVEREAGFILAGQLIVDLPKDTKIEGRHESMIQSIITQLLAEARSGFMPADALVSGWPGGTKPDNAVDTDNDALMTPWADRSLNIALRIYLRDDGIVCTDSDMLAHMGLLRLKREYQPPHKERTTMGADIYLQSVWKPLMSPSLPPKIETADLEAAINLQFDHMGSSGGYFRNGYNSGDIMWAMGLSWHDTVGSMLDERGCLPIERARELIAMIEARPLTRERVAAHVFVNKTDGVEPHPFNGQLMQSMHEAVAEATGQTLPPKAPPDIDHLFRFLNTRRNQLLEILRKSIELNEPLLCSL